MQKDINIYDIARLAGVSKSTVSRVINGHKGVSEATRERVRRVMAESTYIPNNSARSLSSITTQTVVLLVYGVTNPFFSRIISLILEKMNGKGYDVFLHVYEPETRADITDIAVSICKEKRPKGMILLGGNYEGSQEALKALGIPIVMASTTVHGGDDHTWFSSVTLDDKNEGAKMADFIYRSGHRNVAVIGQHYAREQGVKQIFDRHGVQWVVGELTHERAFSYQQGYYAVKRLPKQHAYTCLLCMSDVLAIGAMRAVREQGLRIPEDISVVGFDGIEHAAYTHPPLTTFAQPFDEMAEKSVAILLDIVNEGTPHRHIILNADLEEGGSFRKLD